MDISTHRKGRTVREACVNFDFKTGKQKNIDEEGFGKRNPSTPTLDG
jgi:hypothetical protein